MPVGFFHPADEWKPKIQRCFLFLPLHHTSKTLFNVSTDQ